MEIQKKRHVVVTGATGLIGSHLIRHLSGGLAEVSAFVRNPERDRKRLPEGTNIVEWRAGMDEGPWKEVLASADVIVNLAGAPLAQRWDEKTLKQIYVSRVIGTRNIVEALPDRSDGEDQQVLISGSAVGYYGSLVPNPVDETAPAGEGYPATLTVEWEREAEKAEEKGARVVLLRTGIVLSPEGGAMKELLTPFKMMVGGPIGSGDQPWPWIHIDDEIGLILHAMENENISGPLNAVAPESIDNRRFARAFGDALGRPSVVPAPKFMMRAMLGDAAIVVTEGQNVWPRKAIESGYPFKFTQIDHALGHLLEKK